MKKEEYLPGQTIFSIFEKEQNKKYKRSTQIVGKLYSDIITSIPIMYNNHEIYRFCLIICLRHRILL
jgi:hypothetical protein